MIFIDFNSYGGGSDTWIGLNDRDSENGKIVGGDINYTHHSASGGVIIKSNKRQMTRYVHKA
jgi:hypothetical protein